MPSSSPPADEAHTPLTPVTAPSTSLGIGGIVYAKIRALADEMKGNWQRNFEEMEKQLNTEQLFSKFSFISAVALPVFGEARLAKWTEGWQRVKDIYQSEYSMERHLLTIAVCTGFGMGFMCGGATTLPESKRRFEVYYAGKVFLQKPHSQLRSRRLNYAILRFVNTGCRVGVKLAFGIGSIMTLFLVPIAFRAHFSVLNFPFATIMVFGAHSTFRGWGMIGWHACVPPTIYVNVAPLMIILCCCLYLRCTPNEFYWRMKANIEDEMRTDAEYSAELEAYARARKKQRVFRKAPWTRAQMEREREAGTWIWSTTNDDGLAHLEQQTEETAPPEGDELDEAAEQKLRTALDQKRKVWWQRIWA